MDNTSFIANKQKYINILQKATPPVNGENPPIDQMEVVLSRPSVAIAANTAKKGSAEKIPAFPFFAR